MSGAGSLSPVAGPRWAAAALAILAVGTWAFVYNSGWGYDGLEYLVIGRAMTEGFPFYTFTPSKSFGLYYVTAAFLTLPGASTHAGVSVLITAILFTICLTTAAIVRARYGGRAAISAAALVGVGALYMEQNFLLPEGLVFLCGALAFASVSAAGARRQPWRWIAAGAWIGAGTSFKLVALMYLPAFLVWIPLVSRRDGARVVSSALARTALLTLGLVLALAAPAAYFWATGRLEPHLQWTYWFPLFDYPTSGYWVDKLYTKLLWIWLVVAGAFAVSSFDRVRAAIYGDERIWLILLMGGWALLPLLKSQSTHFAFPGAACLLLFAAIVLERYGSDHESFGAPRTVCAVALLVLCVGSAALYWPSALNRLFGAASFARENQMQHTMQGLVPPDRRAVFFSQGLRMYWLSGRYPTWPILHTDLQATRLLAAQPADFLQALDDPRLSLVEFDRRWWAYGDRRFFDRPEGQAFLDQMHARLQRDFRRDDQVMAPLVLWMRNTDPATND